VSKKGILFAATAYLIWGFFPVYFKAIQQVPALEIIAHRIAWSFIFVTVIMTVRKGWASLRSSVTRRVAGIYTISAVLIGFNWLLYVWAVNSKHVVEASLGYFINPLFMVALGVIVMHEKLRLLQWLPIILAAFGVIYLTIEYGELPWISLGLAFTFGLYAMMKKLAPLNSLHGLTIETGILFLPAVGYILFLGKQGSGSLIAGGWTTTLLLMGAGLATTIPLLLYASAAHELPLWLMGILQYITPTLQFLLGVLIYKEGFSRVQLVGYGMIWLALGIFTTEAIVHWRKSTSLVALPAAS
jgi:chloramphenicol-sensitive protein RarD